MSDILSTGVSGLRAFQKALGVTSHNIANASTPGYTRQRADLVAREPERFGSYYVGTGVDMQRVDRVYDELLIEQMRGASSASSRLETYAGKAQALNNLFSDTSTGISASMQRFMNSVQGVSNEPSSTAARQVMLSEAEGLKQRLQTYDRRLNELNAEINSRLSAETKTISTTAESIAKLNEKIVSATATAGQAPNDLLDARDKMITDLSEHLNVSVTKQDDGAWNVFAGNGQALVLGARAGKFVTQQDAYDPSRLVVAYESGGNTVDMSSSLSGGSIGGLLDFRREMLDPARNQLGQIATGLVEIANSQHAKGMDLQGNLGTDLFSVGGVEVLAVRSNAGSGTLTATRGNVGALTGSNYVMEYGGSAWSLRNADTGAVVSMSGAGTAISPFVADGLEVVVGGTASAGDRFQLRPTAAAVQGMSVNITDPSRIAAAAPIRTSAVSSNTGSGRVSAGTVQDETNPQLLGAVTLQFLTPTSYSINGAGSFAYTAGANIDVNGWRMDISGAPAVGDRFTVGSNAGGVGDNRNALALSDMLGTGVFSGGSESINGAITRFVGGIGSATNQANTSAEAQGFILTEARDSVDSVSGVNLDEEAANMMRYQQAYQAAAQVIRATQDMFDTLLRATSR
jgi:flagellar hook-associated protein 1